MSPRPLRRRVWFAIAGAILTIATLGWALFVHWRPAPIGANGNVSRLSLEPSDPPSPATPPAIEEAAKKAAEGRWADAIAILEHQIHEGPPSPAAFHLLAVCATQAGRDIEAAMAYRALVALDPSSASDPVFQRELAAILDRLAARAETFFNAAATAAGEESGQGLQQYVVNRMVAAGQLALARKLVDEQRLDLSRALILASIEAQEQTGKNFAWQLLQLVPGAIPQDADNDVALLRNLSLRALHLVPGQINSRGTFVPMTVTEDEGLRHIREKPGLYRLQAMGIRWIWYSLAARSLSTQDGALGYWKGQDLIYRSHAALEFNPNFKEVTSEWMFSEETNPERLTLWNADGKLVVPHEVYQLPFTPDGNQLLKVDFAALLAEKQIALPVETTHSGLATKRALSSLEAVDVDALEPEPTAEFVKHLADLGYWYSMALKTLSYS